MNGLDPSSAILMRKILQDLVRQGTTILLSSHNLAEVDRVTKNILFLKDGQLLFEDMRTYETVYYHFNVSDRLKTKELLTENRYKYEENAEGFKVQLDSSNLQNLINLIAEKEISILDIRKEVTSSEKRYEELFEV